MGVAAFNCLISTVIIIIAVCAGSEDQEERRRNKMMKPGYAPTAKRGKVSRGEAL